MPERVVDGFEPIEVEIQGGHALAAAGPAQAGCDLLSECHAVRQSSQGIMPGQMIQLGAVAAQFIAGFMQVGGQALKPCRAAVRQPKIGDN